MMGIFKMKTFLHIKLLALALFAGSTLFAQSLNVQSEISAEPPLRVELDDAKLLKTTQKMRKETAYLVLCVENGHYLRMPLNKIDIREFLREYMQNLDFIKLFFTANDVQYYQDSYSSSMEVLLKEGVLLPANTIYYETFVPRAKARLDWIRERMTRPFDLTVDETFKIERAKEEWPANVAEADALWERLLKFDIIGRMLGYEHRQKELAEALDEDGSIPEDFFDDEEDGELPKTYEEKLEKAKAEVLKRYERVIANIIKNDPMEIQEVFLNSLCALYDPHSSFLSEYQMEEFDISIRNSLVGIGAVLYDKDGYCHISELIPGGPAEKSKELEPGDKIVGVGQENEEIVEVIGGKLRNTVRFIRGKAGTKVRLKIESKKTSAPKIVTLVREEVQLTTKLAKAHVYEMIVGDKTVPIGVIELLAFYGEGESEGQSFSTAKDVEELIGKLKERNVGGIILDMRKNGGGLLGEAVDLAGLFIRTGPVVQIRDTRGNDKALRDDDPKVVWDGPLAVLVSRLSASAAEIVAGALQNHERAIIIGDKNTYGKGTVQVVYKLSNFDITQKSAAKITVQKWYLPNGESIQVKGVHSDIYIPSILEHIDLGEDKKDHVLPWDKIDAASIRAGFGYGKGEGGSKLLEELKKRSEQRRATMSEFKFLDDRIDWFKERQDRKELNLNYELREKDLRKDEEFSDKMDKRQKEFAKDNYKSEEILLDSVIAKEAESKAIKDEAKAAEEKSSEENAVADAEKSEPADSKKKSKKKESLPEFDIHMREALRVMQDWVDLANN